MQQATEGARPVRPDGLAEIVLLVQDVRSAAAFYERIVGLVPETEVDDEWAWFWTGEPGSSARLALHRGSLLFEEHSPLPPGRRFGAIHLALRIGRARIEEAVSHLRRAGIEVHGPVRLEWMGADSWYFYDLDGNLLEYWSPDPPAPPVPPDPQ